MFRKGDYLYNNRAWDLCIDNWLQFVYSSKYSKTGTTFIVVSVLL